MVQMIFRTYNMGCKSPAKFLQNDVDDLGSLLILFLGSHGVQYEEANLNSLVVIKSPPTNNNINVLC